MAIAGAATAAVAVATAGAAGAAGAAGVVAARIEHQRVKMKRTACIICKQAAEEEKREIK